MTNAEFESNTEREIGLRMPDGSEIWPGQEWHGHTVDTPEGRQSLVDAIKTSAGNLNIAASTLLQNYWWMVRINHVHTIRVEGSTDVYPIDSPSLLVDVSEESIPDNAPPEPLSLNHSMPEV